MPGGGRDPQLCVGAVVGAQGAVLGDQHRIVVPVRAHCRHRDRCQARALGGSRDPPARDRRALGVPRRTVGRRGTIDRACGAAPKERRTLRAALLRAGAAPLGRPARRRRRTRGGSAARPAVRCRPARACPSAARAPAPALARPRQRVRRRAGRSVAARARRRRAAQRGPWPRRCPEPHHSRRPRHGCRAR